MKYGYRGSILYVDLTKRKYWTESLKEYKHFIGGRGINVKLLSELTQPDTDPLGPENPLIFGAGPWIGTLAPTACRLSVEFKSVINRGLGSGNAGGHFAAEMKFCGYDHIVVLGKSDEKVYLYIKDQRVFFRDSKDIWREDTWQTDIKIKELEQDKNLKSLCIGEAGINQVAFATIIVDRARTVGYGGSGAVMGSKNLKAIAISGSGQVTVAKPVEFISYRNDFIKNQFYPSQAVKNHQKGGTLLPYTLPLSARPHGVRNMSDDYWDDESISSISREVFDNNFVIQRKGCFDCPVYCSSIYKVKNLYSEGFHANSFRSFGSNIDSKSSEGAFYANALANRLGLDSDHLSSVIAWSIECFEKGLINIKDTEGLILKWDDIDTVVKLIEMIAKKEGFGSILALGLYKAVEFLGKGENLAMTVKKNALMEAATRPYKGWALGIMTSTKAGGHLRGAPGQESQKLNSRQSMELLGIEDYPPVNSYDYKADLVVFQEQYKAVIDSMGICVLASSWTDVDVYNFKHLSDFHFLITGEDLDVESLKEVGEKIQTIERMYNLINAGFSRKDDLPPAKLVENQVTNGPFKGEFIDLEKYNKMLDQYYANHGWEIAFGIPTKTTLKKLNLDYLIKLAEKSGIELPL